MRESDSEPLAGTEAVSRFRALAKRRATELGRADLADDAALVVSELATNAVLHAGGVTAVALVKARAGLRVEVHDASRVPPVMAQPSEESLTGRGLRLVASVAERWGADTEPDGKVVWAELSGRPRAADSLGDDDVLSLWDDWDVGPASRVVVELGDVPTELLLAAKSHVDNVVRESTLAAAGAASGISGEIPAHLGALLSTVVERFAEARVAIKHQALEAARRGEEMTNLVLALPPGAADAAVEYLAALDELDVYSRARRLLTLETPVQHRVFRDWYINELVVQLRAAASGHVAPPPQRFEKRLLAEIERVVATQRAAERAARLYSLAAALATAATPEAVSEAVLQEGVAALGAAAGGVLLAAEGPSLTLPGAVGYEEDVVARLRTERRDAELPAAEALRSGEPVWLESRGDRDRRFPQLAGLEADTVAMCALPLAVGNRLLGALRFSFREQRLFDDDERRFALALAAQTAQALDRAQLQQARVDVSRRLQRSLLPPSLPALERVEVAAMYHPFGDGIDVGGDFYDLWPLGNDRWGLAVGDAAGTGPEAAALTALVRHTLRAVTLYDADPASVMRALNAALCASADPDADRFCTVVFGIVTLGPYVTLQLASGGHPGPLIARAEGAIEAVTLNGTLLGVFEVGSVDRVDVELRTGDAIVFFTDGVLEARRGNEMFEVEGLVHVLETHRASAAATVAAIERAVLDHTGGVLSDDMAAIALRVS